MIPQEKTAAVARGLREAFGVTAFEDIRIITGGLTSSLVFRIVVRGSPFLLKIIIRTDDPTCHYTCMKAAAEAGLAPHVWYTSIPDRISITDFRGGCTLSSNGRACSDTRCAADPACTTAVSRSAESPQHLMHVPDQQRDCRGRIHPEVSGGEHSP